MKWTMIVLAMGPMSAFAADATLSYTRSSGLGMPRDRRSHVSCTVSADRVSVTTVRGAGEPVTRETRVAWTATVPNLKSMKNLLTRASRGQLVEGPGRAGAGMTQYSGTFSAPNALYAPVTLQRSGARNIRNTAPAARKLVDFIDYNCNKQ